jgi:hypothetical protein
VNYYARFLKDRITQESQSSSTFKVVSKKYFKRLYYH